VQNSENLPRLGRLAQAGEYSGPIDLKSYEANQLAHWLKKMLVIRYAEEKIADKVVDGTISCPCHLAIGQEAVAVGFCESIRPSDRMFGAHRSHSHYLASGAPLDELFYEVRGMLEGCSKGFGGSMHLYAEKQGLKGTVPIVAGTVPLAVGAALAAKMDGQRKKDSSNLDVGVAFFGDGATEEGVVQESLNLAKVYNLPVVFMCENNLFSSHLHIDLRQPTDTVARFAAAAGIKCEVVDGNDIVAVADASRRLIEHCRSGGGPVFLEAITYRWRGHVGPSEDRDVGVRRKDDLDVWKRRDPVRRLVDSLVAGGKFTSAEFDKLQIEVKDQVETAWAKTNTGTYPAKSMLLDIVYSSKAQEQII